MASTGNLLQQELPPQLADFLQRLDAKLDKLSTHLMTIESSITRLEDRITAQELRSEDQAAELADIRADIVMAKKSLSSIPASTPLSSVSTLANSYVSDPCEILLTGVPTDIEMMDEEALGKVFTVMGLKSYNKFLVNTSSMKA
ncbi:hypothetical protein TKK_0013283 [Trichogramma kaykai]|uniref:RRM domain-containing protein n=1 Tax=Trichogramma kaykai TaxID=54128 RepID=A0ABD2WII3_9HYME